MDTSTSGIAVSGRRRRRQEPPVPPIQYGNERMNAHSASTSDDDSEESNGVVVSRVHAGIVSISELARGAQRVEQMNLFGNAIATLDGLQVFTRLQELCLSNNQLEELSFHALDPLKLLRVLDLSANKLTSLRGLPLLPRLEELSVAHNSLTGLEGVVRPVKAPKLRYLDLRGNLLASPVALVPLQHLKRLAHLRLQSRDGAVSNPVCDVAEYPDVMLEILPTLKQLDEEDVMFLREVSRVRMPKYESLVRRLQASQAKRTPPSVDGGSQTTPQKPTAGDTKRELRVFMEAEQRVGVEESRLDRQTQRGMADAASPSHEPRPRRVMEEEEITRTTAASASVSNPPTSALTSTGVERVVLRETSTNTELDFDKLLLERETEALAMRSAFLAREKEFLQRETEFFTKEKEFQERVRQLEGQLTSALERTSKVEEHAVSSKMEWESKLEKMETLVKAGERSEATLQSQLAKLRDEVDRLTSQNEILSTTCKNAQQQITRLEEAATRSHDVDATNMQEANARTSAAVDKLKESEERLREFEIEAKQQLASQDSRIKELSRQLSESSSQHNVTAKQNEYLERQFEELKISRDQYREECLRKDDEVYRLKKALMQKSEELEEAKVQVMKMAERQDRMQEQQQQLYDKQLQAGMMQLEMEFRREHQQATEKLQILHRKYQDSVRQHVRTKGSYESSLKRESLLKDEVQRLSAIVEGDKQRLVDQELTKRAEYEFKIRRLEDEKQALHDELQHAKEKRMKTSDLERQLEDQHQECDRLQAEIKRLEEVVRGWEAEEGDWKAALKVKDVMLDDHVRQLDELRKQKKALEEDYQQDTGEFQAQIEDLEEALDDNLQKVSTLQEKYDRAKEALAVLHQDASKASETMEDLAKQVELKNAALELIEGEMDRMRGMLTNQDEIFQKRLQKYLDQHREELERVRTAHEDVQGKIRSEYEGEKAEMIEKYDALANDLKEMAAQNTKLRVAIDQERRKSLQRDQEMRVLLLQLDQERHVKNERLNDIKRLFEQLQQESP